MITRLSCLPSAWECGSVFNSVREAVRTLVQIDVVIQLSVMTWLRAVNYEWNNNIQMILPA